MSEEKHGRYLPRKRVRYNMPYIAKYAAMNYDRGNIGYVGRYRRRRRRFMRRGGRQHRYRRRRRFGGRLREVRRKRRWTNRRPLTRAIFWGGNVARTIQAFNYYENLSVTNGTDFSRHFSFYGNAGTDFFRSHGTADITIPNGENNNDYLNYNIYGSYLEINIRNDGTVPFIVAMWPSRNDHQGDLDTVDRADRVWNQWKKAGVKLKTVWPKQTNAVRGRWVKLKMFNRTNRMFYKGQLTALPITYNGTSANEMVTSNPTALWFENIWIMNDESVQNMSGRIRIVKRLYVKHMASEGPLMQGTTSHLFN